MNDILLQSGFITIDNNIFTRQELCNLGEEVSVSINSDQITVIINAPKKNKKSTNTFNTEQKVILFLVSQHIIS